MIRSLLRPACALTVILTLLCGALYPAAVTSLAHLLFPWQASGSPIAVNGRVVGSALIGQRFTRPEYFHGRPSAAGDGYDATASGGTNRGPTDSTLAALVALRVDSAVADGAVRGSVPADLVTASASGLDPHISPASARVQIARVARARGVAAGQVDALVETTIEPRQLGVLGEPRINVLRLNMALDSAFTMSGAGKRS